MNKFYELSDDTVNQFNSVFNTKSFPIQVGFQFVGSESQKQLIKIAKLPDQYSFLLGKELLVMMNEDLLNIFDAESIKILIEQELDKVSINVESGKIKMIRPDLNTFASIINKWGTEKVMRANQVEDLYQKQKSDGVEEFDF
jgi:hypothetical protein